MECFQLFFGFLQNLKNKRRTKIIGWYWGGWNYIGDTMGRSHCFLVSLPSYTQKSIKTKTIGIHQLAITSANHVWRDDNYLCFLQTIIVALVLCCSSGNTSHANTAPFGNEYMEEYLGLISLFKGYHFWSWLNDLLVYLEHMAFLQFSLGQ